MKPEYLMEAAGLGVFMIAAGLLATLFEYPASPVHSGIADPTLRRVLLGAAIGLTAAAIIYSPWGQQSGAHLNPAVTLTFWRLGKVKGHDAVAYVIAQFAGGTLGVLLVAAMVGAAFTDAPVRYAVTVPGAGGATAAFIAEAAISGALMFVVLTVSNTRGLIRLPWRSKRAKEMSSSERPFELMRLTGVAAAALVAAYIAIEAPISGMSMNPARSFASAFSAGLWTHQWIYFVAPPAGMLAGAALYLFAMPTRGIACAKLDHPPHKRCIHCGYVPGSAT